MHKQLFTLVSSIFCTFYCHSSTGWPSLEHQTPIPHQPLPRPSLRMCWPSLEGGIEVEDRPHRSSNGTIQRRRYLINDRTASRDSAKALVGDHHHPKPLSKQEMIQNQKLLDQQARQRWAQEQNDQHLRLLEEQRQMEDQQRHGVPPQIIKAQPHAVGPLHPPYRQDPRVMNQLHPPPHHQDPRVMNQLHPPPHHQDPRLANQFHPTTPQGPGAIQWHPPKQAYPQGYHGVGGGGGGNGGGHHPQDNDIMTIEEYDRHGRPLYRQPSQHGNSHRRERDVFEEYSDHSGESRSTGSSHPRRTPRHRWQRDSLDDTRRRPSRRVW